MKYWKTLLAMFLIFALLFTLCACQDPFGPDDDGDDDDGGDPTVQKKVSLTLWSPITGSDLTIFNRLITQFNMEYDGKISVTHSSEVRDNHYNNILNNVPVSGPDMAIIHSQLVMNFAKNGYLVPYDNTFFEKETIDTNDYLQSVISTLYLDNSLYGIPLDVHPIVLYYNKSIVGSNPLPTNYSELMALAQKLTTGEGNNKVWGLPISVMWPSEFVYTTSLYQNGGKEVDKDSMPLFNSNEGAKAAEVMRDIIHLYNVSPNNLQADQDMNMFTSGKAAFHIQGSWALSGMVEALGENLGVMSLSGLFTDEKTETSDQVFGRSHCFCVTTPSKKLSASKKQAIVTFVKWMGQHSDQWSTAGQIPAYNPARESEIYKKAKYLADFGNPDNFRTAMGATYYEAGFETVFEYVTTIMKNNLDHAAVLDTLARAQADAIKSVNTEKEK